MTMNYLNLMKAGRKRGKVPTMEPRPWSSEQQKRIAQGRCAQCGERSADPHSYVCAECQAGDTLEGISNEIKALRNHLLLRKTE